MGRAINGGRAEQRQASGGGENISLIYESIILIYEKPWCGLDRGERGVTLRAEDQFHVGVVVEDFEAALARLSSLFGYQWCTELGGLTQLRLPAGEALLNFRCAYSTASPRLEIVARISGILWEPAADSGYPSRRLVAIIRTASG